jgi:hypothetical protein
MSGRRGFAIGGRAKTASQEAEAVNAVNAVKEPCR